MTVNNTPRGKKRGAPAYETRTMVALGPVHHDRLKRLAAKARRPMSWELRDLIDAACAQAGIVG